MPTQPRAGMSRKQGGHLRRAREARATARKENRPPADPLTQAQQRATAAEAESAQLKREQVHLKKDKKNSSRREKRQKRRIADLKDEVKKAEEKLQDAISRVEDIYERRLTREKLQDQLDKLRARWNTKTEDCITIPKKSHIPKLADKQTALVHAFQAHLKLLEQFPEHSGLSSSPQMEDNLVQEHYHGDDADFGVYEEDLAAF
ncbi:hypothetical protein R3P38DRAFT_3217376 [Favolaschia claudopus]|uniref:Uncharacterized protein n=1 Tax=Favolaschia claudopus TaxID=2862362 RepID=A0AAW0A4M5_9AGAR